MPALIDITGQIFGPWKAIELAPKSGRLRYWVCECQCPAKTRKLILANLLHSRQQKAGCDACQFPNGRGVARSATYEIYMGIIKRCENPNSHAYKWYGARGIKICARWRESFANFLSDMGERPPGMSIDRINNDGDYEPGNCRWATPKQQSQNSRRCKISDEKLAELMRRLSAGETQVSLAKQYGISWKHLSRIVCGQRRQP